MLRFPQNKLTGLRAPSYREEEETIYEARINGGMVTSIDAADIANNQQTDLKNARVRYDKTTRRSGSGDLVPAKPDANKVLLVAPWEHNDDTVDIIRFTATTLYRRATVIWQAIAGVLTGTDNDRFNIAIANDRFFFANGVDPIQEINIGALSFAQLGNAPIYRYIIGFNNRIVGANNATLISPNGIEIGWSGNQNFAEWNTLVDPSAGSFPLTDSTTDFSDDITGLFGFTDIALVLRQRSLWGLAKQPVASQPFKPFNISTNIGCDSPRSAVNVSNGIAWFDLRTRTVWVYKVGMSAPERIGTPVELTIADQVEDVNLLFGTYDTLNDEYTLAIPSLITTTVRLWIYNFKNQTWSYDEMGDVSSVDSIDYSSSALMIDDLVGFIDGLSGFIDDLGNSVELSTRFYGKTDGNILVESEIFDTDGGETFTTTVASKVFKVPRYKGYVQTLNIEYIPRLAGSFTAYYSKDGGTTWNAYKSATWDNTMINRRKRCTFKKHLTVSEYMWKIEATSGIFDLIEFNIAATKSSSEQQSR